MPEYDQWAGRVPEPDDDGHGSFPISSIKRRKTYGYRSGPGRRAAVVPPELLEDQPRRWNELLMPAAVILAGVLIVVAFGFVINHAMNARDGKEAAPAVQPPALGQFSQGPDQAAIPLPSESSSPSPSPSPSPTPSRTPTEKPTTEPPVFTGSIALSRAGISPLVDLTAEGTQDWVHWGEESTFSLERDKDGDFKILEGAPTAPRFRHALSPQRFSWTGGSPVGHSDGTPTGIRTCGKGNGFTLSTPASTTSRTLRLYVGVLAGSGRLSAKLSTGGSTRTGSLTQKANAMSTAVFTITYRAPKTGTLKLSWATTDSFNSDCGGVALEAATLR